MTGADRADRVGTTEAFTREHCAQVLDGVQRPLYTFLRGMVDDAEQARDLVQDTFCEAWQVARRRAPPFIAGHSEREMRRWLFHAAYHHAISALRRRRVITWESLDESVPTEQPPRPFSPSFEEQVIERESLQAALRALPPADVACLGLIVIHRFTAAEVGAIVDATPSAVAKRFARAKARLREAYLTQSTPPQMRSRTP
jgi:RNA polymerase sigma factor (sigma-70 family)